MNAPVSGPRPGLAEQLGRRGLWAAVPFGGRSGPGGVVLASDEGGAVIELGDDDQTGWRDLARWAGRTDRVFVFGEAKPGLRRLLARGVDVARPVCLATLTALCGEERDEASAPSDAASARDRAWAALAELSARLEAVERAGLKRVARLECLVLRAFAALEVRGLYVDVARWRGLVREADQRAKDARREVFGLLGDAVQRDLFGEPDLHLEADAEVKLVLERLLGRPLPDVQKGTLARLGHDVGPALLRFREAFKVVSTYGEAFLARVGDDGRVRATFIPLGASTGRVASRDPNLQNLPSDAAFHECLRAPPGKKLVTADYGTCELRILADLSEDEAFLASFERGEDLHSAVASRMFGTTVSKTERPELRARAKAINFGLMYGMGAAALGQQVGVERDEAEELLEKYFAAYPRIRTFLDKSVDDALARGWAETVLGRKLRFDPEVLAADNARGELGRIAKNMPIQGTSADMTKLAMVRVHERLLGYADAGLVNTVHDELVVECAAEDAEGVGAAVVEEMEAAHRTLLKRVPPQVDLHVGDHWAH